MLQVHPEYWSTNTDGLYPAPNFKARLGMGLYRYQEILMYVAYITPDEQKNGSLWFQVGPMFTWYVKVNYNEGMECQQKKKIKRCGF